jgi:hypothetical protein
VNAGGSWAATNVPASPNGTAIMDIEVYAPGSGPPSGTPIGSLQIDQLQPARVVLMSYSGTRNLEWRNSDPCYPFDVSAEDGDDVRWSYDQGGFLRRWGSATSDQQNPQYDYTNPLSAGQGGIAPPWEFASVGIGISGPASCEYDWKRWDYHTETRLMIEPEGQSSIGESRLYLVRASALQFPPPTVSDTLYSHGELMSGSHTNYIGTIPVSPETLQINGVALANTGETNSDGSTWGATLVQVQAGVRANATPVATQVQGYKDYTFDENADEIKLSITANGVALDPNKVVTNASFIVGQVLTFSTDWSKVPPGVASRTVQWTFEGHFLNDSNQPCADCSPNYTNNQAKLTNEVTAAWLVSGANPAATYLAQLTETLTLSNGSNVVVSGKGLFSMLRPQARIDATAGTVALDTNLLVGVSNNIPIYDLGLHYGTPTIFGTNSPHGPPGIVLSNYFSLPSGVSGSAQFVQVITSYLYRYQTNSPAGTWIRAEGGGLDGTYPYPITRGTTNRMEDSPFANIDGPPYCFSKRMVGSSSFLTWLEFKPMVLGEAHWVPLRRVA